MFLELKPGTVILLNLLFIPSVHLGVSWLLLKFPQSWFVPDRWWFRERNWERGGAVYQSLFRVRVWKRFLPDGGAWLGGFKKAQLSSHDLSYLGGFRVECSRGESAHVVQFFLLLGALIWNPWPTAGMVILSYAVLSNLPCVLVQRFNRLRVGQFINRVEARES